MGYDPDFYNKYRAYLLEDTVRRSHDIAFTRFWLMAKEVLVRKKNPVNVADFGCGIGEYSQYGGYSSYIGIDVNDANPHKEFDFDLVNVDYHDLDKLAKVLVGVGFEPTAFISLFSIEPCHSADERYMLYDGIFRKFPSIKVGMASGFFYKSKRDQETVAEAGGIVSYQTIELPAQYVSTVFIESRLSLDTPSRMFGQDVVEIWKFFTRR